MHGPPACGLALAPMNQIPSFGQRSCTPLWVSSGEHKSKGVNPNIKSGVEHLWQLLQLCRKQMSFLWIYLPHSRGRNWKVGKSLSSCLSPGSVAVFILTIMPLRMKKTMEILFQLVMSPEMFFKLVSFILISEGEITSIAVCKSNQCLASSSNLCTIHLFQSVSSSCYFFF